MDLIACPKLRRRMKLVLFLLLTCTLYASAKGHSQTITLSVKNRPIEEVFKQITAQSGYLFFYNTEQLKTAKPVSLTLKNATLEVTLQKCFDDQPLTFTIINKTIVVKTKSSSPVEISPNVAEEIKGKVINENGDPVAGITVRTKGTNHITFTDSKGEFSIPNAPTGTILVISGAEIKPQEIIVGDREYITIKISAKIGELDQVVMMAYGQTTRRLNTGNIAKISAEDISKQPVGNAIAALSGRVAGLVITQNSGIPGAAFNIQLRGQNSIGVSPGRLPLTNPLFVIDGIPFNPGNAVISQYSSAANNPLSASEGGISPMSMINPNDIESIEILKDADATAIYGSRAANGVVLITTKRGKPGKTKININIYQGYSSVTKRVNMLNTPEYLSMRREAFRNDGVTPGNNTAPDLLLWDSTKSTNWQKELIGGTAKTSSAQASISGGNANTQFLVGTGIFRESSVYPGDLSYLRASAQFNLSHSSQDKRFSMDLSTSFANEDNKLPTLDLAAYMNLPPNFPSLRDSLGKLNWQENGISFSSLNITNPLSYLVQKYNSESSNLLSSLRLNFKIAKGLELTANLGYTQTQNRETSTSPSTSYDPQLGILPSAHFLTGLMKGWTIEPRLQYSSSIATNNKITLMVGSTWQQNITGSISTHGYNYANDELLGTIAGAGIVQASTGYLKYRYSGLYARIGYNFKDMFLLNASGRRDGSSRFGPGKQFANFGGIGIAWILTKSKLLDNLSWLSFAKLRSSYGITGKDDISDYQFLETWNPVINPYQGTPGLQPTHLYNPEYRWENNKKFEAGIELAFFSNRLSLSASYFLNRSGNQLISYQLPIQTGFTSVIANSPALIQNSGIEILLGGKIISNKEWNWSMDFNLTRQKNKLLEFPGLENSSYKDFYTIGASLTQIKGYQFLGIDPATGLYTFNDVNQNGGIEKAGDYLVLEDRAPKFYGGLKNTVAYKSLSLDLFFEFRKQVGQNFLANQNYMGIPGFMVNQPRFVLDRWQNPGDASSFQKYSQTYGDAYNQVALYLSRSNGIYSDASFIRLKNISLNYDIRPLFKWKNIESLRIYINAQNLLTITNYKGADPESQNYYRLPPLKTIAFGVQLTF